MVSLERLILILNGEAGIGTIIQNTTIQKYFSSRSLPKYTKWDEAVLRNYNLWQRWLLLLTVPNIYSASTVYYTFYFKFLLENDHFQPTFPSKINLLVQRKHHNAFSYFKTPLAELGSCLLTAGYLPVEVPCSLQSSSFAETITALTLTYTLAL